MLFVQAAALLLLLMVCAFAPGFVLVRKLRWSALERLCGSIALSLILLWLAAWAIYVSGAPWSVAYAVSAACVAAALLAWKEIAALFRSGRVRRAAIAFAAVIGWTIVMLATIRHYSGAGWQGDWVEQFHRSLFFLHRFPAHTLLFGGYPLPARPPMPNVLTAFFLAQVGDRFEFFQLLYSCLNALPFLACALIAPALHRPRRGWIVVLTAIFALNPLVMQNATYAWTKSLCAFFIILSLHLYLAALRKRDNVRMVACFVALAAGLLVHYSAGPYCVVLAAIYLFGAFAKRPARTRELGLIAATVSLLLLTWFAWSFATYGIAPTFRAPAETSINYGPPYAGSAIERVLGNVIDSIVPHALHDSSVLRTFTQPNSTGYLRDTVFVAYQSTIVIAMGCIGGPLVIWFLVRAFRRRTPESRFWLLLIALIVVAGFAVVGERDYFGTAQLTLVPLLLIGLTFLALHFRASRTVAALIIAGLAIDFGLGVFLQARVEHLENTPQQTVFGALALSNGALDIGVPLEHSLTQAAWGNWFRKHQVAASEVWLRQLAAFRPDDPTLAPSRGELRQNLEKAIADDASLWHGWYRNHSGEMTFLGDHFGDTDITSVLMVIGAITMLWQLARRIPTTALATPAKSKPVHTKTVRVRQRP